MTRLLNQLILLLLENRTTTKLLKVFFDLGEVFTGRFYSVKIFDDKYEVVELKDKADDIQSKLETQNEPLEMTKKKSQNLKKVSQKE